MSAKHLINRVVRAGRESWSPEVAMRYLPLLPLVGSAPIVEVGSGNLGIAPYLGGPVVGVDPVVDPTHHGDLKPVRAVAAALPFPDSSVPVVLCVDALEHVPPTARRLAVQELARVVADVLVVAVPAGDASERHDARLDAYFRDRHGGLSHPFFDDHLSFGLPRPGEVASHILSSGRPCEVETHWNSNLRVREFLMRRWAAGGRRAEVASLVGNRMTWLLRRASFGECYREVTVARFRSVDEVPL